MFYASCYEWVLVGLVCMINFDLVTDQEIINKISFKLLLVLTFVLEWVDKTFPLRFLAGEKSSKRKLEKKYCPKYCGQAGLKLNQSMKLFDIAACPHVRMNKPCTCLEPPAKFDKEFYKDQQSKRAKVLWLIEQEKPQTQPEDPKDQPEEPIQPAESGESSQGDSQGPVGQEDFSADVCDDGDIPESMSPAPDSPGRAPISPERSDHVTPGQATVSPESSDYESDPSDNDDPKDRDFQPRILFQPISRQSSVGSEAWVHEEILSNGWGYIYFH